MTPDVIRGIVNTAARMRETNDFANLPETLRAPVEYDLAAVPAIVQRASERIGHIRSNVLLSDAGKDESIARVMATEETHLERLEETHEKDLQAYSTMKDKAERGMYVPDGTGYIERAEKPPTAEEHLLDREIRDRLYAMPLEERNRAYYSAVQNGDLQLQRAVERAPASFPLVTNQAMVNRFRLETSPAASALLQLQRALDLRQTVIGHARRAWDADKDRLVGSGR